MPHSTNQFDRAGERIRHAVRSGGAPAADDLDMVEAFRSLHLPGLLEVQRLLAHVHTTAGGTLLRGMPDLEPQLFHVASRPKTTPAIVQKLSRSTTRLSRMQDIVGGRIVVPLLWVQDAVVEGIAERLGVQSGDPIVKDTRSEGDQLGYRAVHIVFQVHGLPVEIQVRSARQQVWAQTVEFLDQRMGTDLKHGVGPADWLEWLKDLSTSLRNGDLDLPNELPEPPR